MAPRHWVWGCTDPLRQGRRGCEPLLSTYLGRLGGGHGERACSPAAKGKCPESTDECVQCRRKGLQLLGCHRSQPDSSADAKPVALWCAHSLPQGARQGSCPFNWAPAPGLSVVCSFPPCLLVAMCVNAVFVFGAPCTLVQCQIQSLSPGPHSTG